MGAVRTGFTRLLRKLGEPQLDNVREMLAQAKEMEQYSVRSYNQWANECAAHADSASKKLFEDLVVDEERHFDQYEVQEENIKKFGEQFLALQSMERSKSLAGSSQGGA